MKRDSKGRFVKEFKSVNFTNGHDTCPIKHSCIFYGEDHCGETFLCSIKKHYK